MTQKISLAQDKLPKTPMLAITCIQVNQYIFLDFRFFGCFNYTDKSINMVLIYTKLRGDV
jgi:hypothetical protein